MVTLFTQLVFRIFPYHYLQGVGVLIMSFGICPACGLDIQFQDTVQVGQNTVCPRCHELLAIVTLNPIILEIYQRASFSKNSNGDKKEPEKKANPKNKHHFGEFDDNEDKDDAWKREIRKLRSRKVNDW